MVTMAMAVLSIVQVDQADADALSSFDAELLALINEHRVSKGLDPYIEYSPLSSAALQWSNRMLDIRESQNPAGCPTQDLVNQFLVHDSGSNVATQGVPPNTTATAENIAWSCGYVGLSTPVNWSYSAMPAKCQGSLDYTSALLQFCGWVDSPTHRQNLESPLFTYIGVGSTIKASGTQREPLVTARFAAAPLLPICDGSIVTINMNENGGNGDGTEGDDVILGTPGDDVIRGYGGNDKICAGAGRDIVRGGGGDDRIFGGSEIDKIWGDAGHDVIHGDGGSDRIRGGSGSDTIWAGSGADRVWGGPGHDQLNGMGGQDFMWGDAGNDTIQGNFQTDRLHGGDDNDAIYGAGGKDKIYGDGGDDQLFGGDNTDYLDGGAGTDLANGGRGKDNPLVADVSGCVAETRISC